MPILASHLKTLQLTTPYLSSFRLAPCLTLVHSSSFPVFRFLEIVKGNLTDLASKFRPQIDCDLEA